MRLLKTACALLCVLLALGAAGAAAEGGAPGIPVNVGTWADLNEAAKNGATEVIVTRNIVCGENDATVVFKNAVSIQGHGEGIVSIDGNGKQAIRIEGADEVTPVEGVSRIGGLTMMNCDATGDEAGFNRPGCGGAVFVHGDLIVDTCEFGSNRARCGGAIYTVGALTLNACVFSMNEALESGGAVYTETGAVEITGSMFVANSAPEEFGGALCTNGEATMMTETQCMENQAAYGGAIYSRAGETTINGGMIIANYASEDGGGVYTKEGVVYDTTGSVAGNDPNDIVQP